MAEGNAMEQKVAKDTKKSMPVQAAEALHDQKVADLVTMCGCFKEVLRRHGLENAMGQLLQALDEERHAAEYLARVKQPQLTEEDLRKIERGLRP